MVAGFSSCATDVSGGKNSEVPQDGLMKNLIAVHGF